MSGPSTDLLGALGLSYPDRPEEPAPERESHANGNRRTWTEERIVERIVQWDAEFGAPPTKADWWPEKLIKMAQVHAAHGRVVLERIRRFREGDWPTEATVREVFGSVNAARVAAGYPVVPPGRQPRSTMPDVRPKMGAKALRGYYAATTRARETGDTLSLKDALYTLALSAIREADRIDGEGIEE